MECRCDGESRAALRARASRHVTYTTNTVSGEKPLLVVVFDAVLL